VPSTGAAPAEATKAAPEEEGRPLALTTDGTLYRDFVHGYTYHRLTRSATAVSQCFCFLAAASLLVCYFGLTYSASSSLSSPSFIRWGMRWCMAGRGQR
jgi:hypothetical protein